MNEIQEFLKESNAIEGVHDEDSLVQATKAWKFLISKNKLTLGDILETHQILMINQKNLKPPEKGYLRKVPVYIGGKEALNYIDIPLRLENWIKNANDIVENGQEESDIFLDRANKEQHVRYEKIHPFVDGNGRTGRLFMNWQRLKVGLPILIIKAEERAEYYKWFK